MNPLSAPARFAPRTLLLAVLLAVFLVALAVLQYRWLAQLSAGEQERRQANLDASASLFGEHFDRELTRAYGTFQSALFGDEAGLEQRLLEQYALWVEEASFSPTIRDVYWYPTGAPDRLLRLSFDEQALVPSEWPQGVRAEVLDLEAPVETDSRGIVRRFSAVLADPPLLVIPHYVPTPAVREPRPAGWLIVVLDGAYLRDVVVPTLLSRYGLDEEYDVLISSPSAADSILYRSDARLTSQDFRRPDATAELGRIRTEDFFFRMLWPGAAGEVLAVAGMVPSGTVLSRDTTLRQRQMMVHVERRDANGGDTPAENGDVRPGPVVRYAAMPPAGTLLVRHRAGSLENAVARVRARNLIVSFSVLLLLAGSVMLIVASARRAERLSDRQVQFVAGVSHELRTPLAVIRSAAENLADGVVLEPEKARRYGTLIRDQGRLLSEMVEQILLFSGLQNRRRVLQLLPASVEQLVQAAVDAQRISLGDEEFVVDVSIPGGLPRVSVDVPAMTSAIGNLISNAVKYGGTSKRVHVEASSVEGAGGRDVEIAVCDYGPGIDPDERDLIFEPFYRGREAVASQIHGSGLGLGLVKQIVEAHGGRIELRAGKRGGACFAIRLPAAGDVGEGGA